MELFESYDEVQQRRAWEVEQIKEKLERNELADMNICKAERVSADSRTVRLGLKRGKLLYVFKYPHHNVERDKHRNVITRARFVKAALENAGYVLIPWDFKKGQPPRFWDEDDGAMDEEDDELYGTSNVAAPAAQQQQQQQPPVEPSDASAKKEDDGEGGDQSMDEGMEESDSDDSESDLEIIIDKPAAAPKPIVQAASQESRAIKIEPPPQQSSTPSQQSAKAAGAGGGAPAPQIALGQGAAYPAVRTSNVDVDGDPTYQPLNKPITQVDIDADLAEANKPWRVPGSDPSDYFNYGFDEFTWEMYRQRHQNMANTLAAQKAETAQLQSFFGNMGMGGPTPNNASGGGGGGGGGGAPPTGPAAATGGGGAGTGGGPPMGPGGAGPGMPNDETMNAMMQQMMQSGMDPSQMDFSTFAQMMGGFGAPPSGGPQGGFQGGGGGGGQGGGRGGGGGGRRGRGGW